MRRIVRVGCGVLMGGLALLVPARAAAQQKAPPKRGQAIEIRGQVPTPQVVTVRPREVPAYDRQILSPAFYAGSGSTASAGGVQVVPESQVRGTTALDTLPAGVARENGAPAAATGLAPLQVRSDTSHAVQAPVAARAGASASEIEAMRHELAVRRARLDSLRRALNESMQTPVPTGKVPAARAAHERGRFGGTCAGDRVDPSRARVPAAAARFAAAGREGDGQTTQGNRTKAHHAGQHRGTTGHTRSTTASTTAHARLTDAS